MFKFLAGYFIFVVYFLSFSENGNAATYNTFPRDTPITPLCNNANFDWLIQAVTENMTNNNVAADSIERVQSILMHFIETNTFLLAPIRGQWTPEPYSTLADKLHNLLADCSSQIDSIDKVCGWIASRYPFGDFDPASSSRDPDSTWFLMNTGNLQGVCGDFSSFFVKIVDLYYPHWGIPILFTSEADDNLSTNGPSHVWVGLVDKKANVWAVCDPTLGGMVKDSQTGRALSLKEVQTYLPLEKKCSSLKINNRNTSLQTWGSGCVPRIMLTDTTKLTYFATPIEVVEGSWDGWDSNSTYVSYWLKKGLPRITFMNVYLDIRYISVPNGNNDIVESILKGIHPTN